MKKSRHKENRGEIPKMMLKVKLVDKKTRLGSRHMGRVDFTLVTECPSNQCKNRSHELRGAQGL